MDILAFLTVPRAIGSRKGVHTRKLLRESKARASAYASPSLVTLERKQFRPVGSPQTRTKVRRDGITETYSLSAIDDLLITFTNEVTNQEFTLVISCVGDGSYDLLSLDGSLLGYALFEQLNRVEIKAVIDEAERTGFLDAQDAMVERLSLDAV